MDIYDPSVGKWIIDTDPGTDDAFAIIFALHYIKEHLIALSIEDGTVGIEKCFINAKKVLAIQGKGNIPIYKGCSLNLSGVKFIALSHGTDGLLNLERFVNYESRYDTNLYKQEHNEKYPILDQCSPTKIVELAYKYDYLNILAIGPLTNIAVAFMLDPNIVKRIRKLVIMGGSYNFSGNKVPTAEFNFCSDNIAAKIVLDNFKNIIVYPWETCTKHLLSEKELKHCIEDNDRSHFCKQIIEKKRAGAFSDFGGVYADFGCAISAFNPRSIKKSRYCHADVTIDGSPSMNGSFVIDKNSMSYKFGNKVQVIEELHDEMFKESFINMIK